MVERSLSMREVPGSMSGFYNFLTDKKESRVESQKGTTQIEGKKKYKLGLLFRSIQKVYLFVFINNIRQKCTGKTQY